MDALEWEGRDGSRVTRFSTGGTVWTGLDGTAVGSIQMDVLNGRSWIIVDGFRRVVQV